MNENFIKIANNLIDRDKEIKLLLEYKCSEIKEYQKNLNQAKTVGTVVSTVGATATVVGVGLSFFTGGLSLVTAAGIGSALSLFGGSVSVGADVVDLFKSKSFNEQVDDICKRRAEAAREFENALKEIENEKEKLLQFGLSKQEAFSFYFHYGKNSYSVLKKLYDAKKFGKIANASRTITNFGVRSGGKAWKGIRNLSNYTVKAFDIIGINISKKIGMQIAKTSTIVLSMGFAIWDIKSLIHSLTNEHPTVDNINKIIEFIDSEISKLENFNKMIGQIGKMNILDDESFSFSDEE